MTNTKAKFAPGQQVEHLLFNYRGLIYDVDPIFMGSEAWYEQMAKSGPPKDKPWYHVLVHGADHTTYVAERHLEAYQGSECIDHPLLAEFFDAFDGGMYHSKNIVS
ncbi:MAG: heat shock protein HspQ [Gammaproteobacteria bacterium]|nr:heat shock protein HspQ [Gammaproteobacteria bacterium]